MDDEFYDSFDSTEESEGDFIDHDETTEGPHSLHETYFRPVKEPPAVEPQSARGHSQSTPTDPFLLVSKPLHFAGSSPKMSPRSRMKFPKIKRPPLGNIKQKIIHRKKKVFGVSLQTAVYRSQLGADGLKLPTVFRECIDYLEENALEHEGLYRLAAVKSHILAVKALYNKGNTVNLSEYDPNTVASLLKLFLREFPEPLIPPKLFPRFEAAVHMDSKEMQQAILKLLLDELPACNSLLLGWLLTHMAHVAANSAINKMNIVNLEIVFSPSLQITIPVLHALYNNRAKLFPNVRLHRYSLPRQHDSPAFDIPDPDSFNTEEEVTSELKKLTEVLEKLQHRPRDAEGRNLYDERDDYCWELQRVVTELKRKKKLFEKMSASKQFDEQEFMKTLIMMDATLQAENNELRRRNAELKDQIRLAANAVEDMKSELKRRDSLDDQTTDESGDEAELSQKIASLKWHRRELQMEQKNLLEEVEKEEQALLRLRIAYRIQPLEQDLGTSAATAH